MKKYIVIQNIFAQNVRVEQNATVLANYPAMTSVLGAVHSIFRKLEASEAGVMPIYHSCEMQTGYNRQMVTSPGLNEKTILSGTTLILRPMASINFSLVIEIDRYVSGLEEDIERLLMRTRIAGANLFLRGGISFVEGIEELNNLLGKMKRGFVLSDETAELGENALADLIQRAIFVVEPKNNKAEGKQTDIPVVQEQDSVPDLIEAEKKKGWFVPAAIGFAAFTEKKQRANGRMPDNNGNHCYVEGVTGLVEALFIGNIPRKRLAILERKVFWKYSHDEENMLYLAKGNSASGEDK